MDVDAIDHVNLRIPPDSIDTAVTFYVEKLGFSAEGLEAHRDGKQSFFDIRLTPGQVIHLWPTAEFESPTGTNFNHLALRIERDISAIKRELADADVDVESELESPLGATGKGAAVYVRDPFGYQLEFKSGSE